MSNFSHWWSFVFSVEALERGHDFSRGLLDDADQQAGAAEAGGVERRGAGEADEGVRQEKRERFESKLGVKPTFLIGSHCC